MRFFLEFVSCCGPPTLRPADIAGFSHPHEEENSLVPPASRTLRRKKRGRVGKSPATPEWRPSLGSISEDSAMPLRERADPRNGKMGSGRDVKRRSSGGNAAAAKVHHRNSSDDYGRPAMSTFMPAFSPTPFIF